MMKTYSELKQLTTFADRYEYLRLNGNVAQETFGHERFMNQKFYRSREWQHVRWKVIARDLGCDLGIPGREIVKQIQVHHMNPMNIRDLYDFNEDVLNLEYLISASHGTHNAIHYGDEPPQTAVIIERTPNDHIPWRRTT